MIRCVRLWTGDDGGSHAEVGTLDMAPGRNADLVSVAMSAAHVTVEETAGGGSLAWHTAPVRQLVVTLAGTLRFCTRDGEEFTLAPGDVLLAEDTTGSGHQWELIDGDPWRRMYVVLAPGTEVPFVAAPR
jgi:quercetin dioxygenase-like cupin family protein